MSTEIDHTNWEWTGSNGRGKFGVGTGCPPQKPGYRKPSPKSNKNSIDGGLTKLKKAMSSCFQTKSGPGQGSGNAWR